MGKRPGGTRDAVSPICLAPGWTDAQDGQIISVEILTSDDLPVIYVVAQLLAEYLREQEGS